MLLEKKLFSFILFGREKGNKEKRTLQIYFLLLWNSLVPAEYTCIQYNIHGTRSINVEVHCAFSVFSSYGCDC